MPTIRAPSTLLQETAAEIGKLLPALILLPEGGLIDRLVGALEEAQCRRCRLRGDEDLLLKRLRRSRAISTAWTGTMQAAWNRVHPPDRASQRRGPAGLGGRGPQRRQAALIQGSPDTAKIKTRAGPWPARVFSLIGGSAEFHACSPPHHAEVVSSTRRGDGSGVGVWSAATSVPNTPVMLDRNSTCSASWRANDTPTPNPSPQGGGGPVGARCARGVPGCGS